jgi:hypothetical protein
MCDFSQGSSLLATLGFVTESLWDSASLVEAPPKNRQLRRHTSCGKMGGHGDCQNAWNILEDAT